MPYQHQQQHGRAGAPGQRQQHYGQCKRAPHAHAHGQAHPFPGMGGAPAQRRRQRREHHAHHHHGQREQRPARCLADHAVAQKAGNQQTQRHAQQLAAGGQGVERGVAHGQPIQERGVGQDLDQGPLQPLEHLPQAERQGRREQQGQRPQSQQHQRAMGILHEPPVAKVAPAVDGAQPLQRRRRERPGQRACRIEQQIHVGRHAPGQVDLQELQGQRQQHTGHRGQHPGTPAPAHAQQSERQQEAQRGIAHQVGGDVKAGPVGRRNRRGEEHPGIDALCAPAVERKQAGKDDQRRIDQSEGAGRAFVHGRSGAVRKA